MDALIFPWEKLLLLLVILAGSSICVWLEIVRFRESELLLNTIQQNRQCNITLYQLQSRDKAQVYHFNNYLDTLSKWQATTSDVERELPVSARILHSLVRQNCRLVMKLGKEFCEKQ